MKSTLEQFHSLLREALLENQVTASDMSARMESHYTYIYNTIRKNSNVTLRVAERFAEAAGYHLELRFVPKDGSRPLTGMLSPNGEIYTQRRKAGTAPKAAASAISTEEAEEIGKSALAESAEAALDAEIQELLDLEIP